MMIHGWQVGEWVAQRIHGRFHAEDSAAIGEERNGRIVGGVIYESMVADRSCVTHIAIEGRVSREFWHAACSYAFDQCRLVKVIAPVSSDNTKSVKLVSNMGFREEARIRDAAPRGDLILFTLQREDCRLLGESYGERRNAAAHA